jgi:hypothetical protein
MSESITQSFTINDPQRRDEILFNIVVARIDHRFLALAQNHDCTSISGGRTIRAERISI